MLCAKAAKALAAGGKYIDQVREIAEFLDVSEAMARKILVEAGVLSGRNIDKIAGLIKKRVDSGETISSIAKDVGFHRETVAKAAGALPAVERKVALKFPVDRDFDVEEWLAYGKRAALKQRYGHMTPASYKRVLVAMKAAWDAMAERHKGDGLGVEWAARLGAVPRRGDVEAGHGGDDGSTLLDIASNI